MEGDHVVQPPRWIWTLFLVLVAMAPGSTKVAGSIWFLMVGVAIWCVLFVPKAKVLLEEETELLQLSRLWLRFCVAAMVFKAVGMTYWDDPWWTRHFDFRILSASMSVPVYLARYRVTQAQKAQLVVALVIASSLALFVAYRLAYHDVDTPSNRINWSGGLVMLSCVMLPLLKDDGSTGSTKWAVGLGLMAYVLAVLLIGARGAYLAMPWVILGGLLLLGARMRSLLSTTKKCLRLSMILVALLVAVPVFLPKALEVPVERVNLGLSQLQAMLSHDTNSDAIDTSVGTRLYMWQRSKQVIASNLWMGVGRENRITFIKDWGGEVNAHIVTEQTHLHSEYINGMVDHGIFGLLSTLSYMVGLAVLAWKLRRWFPLAAFSVGGIAYTHVMMSFTDTNSQTNNYSVMLTISLLMVFIMALKDPIAKNRSSNKTFVTPAQ